MFKKLFSILAILFVSIPVVSAETEIQNFLLQRLQDWASRPLSLIAENGNKQWAPKTRENSTSFSLSGSTIFGNIQIGDTESVQPFVFITQPDDGVVKIPIASENIAANWWLKNKTSFTISVPLYQSWDYTVELMDSRGLIFYKQKIAFWKNIVNNPGKVFAENPKEDVQKIIEDINTMRESLQYAQLTRSDLLQKIAERKLADMIENQYVGHRSIGGKNIFSFVEPGEKNFLRLGENVSGGRNVNLQKLANGIFDSPAHRYNLLFPAWRQIGIAYGEKDGNQYLVQVFSD